MTMLESPNSAADLYLAASSAEVGRARPVLTGDVFAAVDIPGTSGTELGIVLTHPCSMRADGVNLADRILMARVHESPEIPLEKWATGHFKVMPLPGLLAGQYSASFDEIGLVVSDILDLDERVACLTPFGINLLQQRFVWHLTRFLAPTHRLGEAADAVFVEADLCEEWVDAWMDAGADRNEAADSFHEWIRGNDESGVRRQVLLAQTQRRAGIRREMRKKLPASTGGRDA